MEPATKADLKAFFAEIRGEIKQWVAEEFRTCKPAFAADPLDPLPLKATSPPTTTGDAIPVLAAAAAGDGTSDEEAITATPAIVEKGPEVVIPASTSFISTAPTTCSMEGLVRDSIDSRSAIASMTAPMVHTATGDIDTVLAASAASDGTFDGQATSGVVASPAPCLMVCLPRHPVATPVLVASSPPIPKEYAFNTIRIHVAAVPMAMTGEFRPNSIQPIASKVPVHRPIPWPSFLDVHPNGDETRPLPWPSFRLIYIYGSPSDVIIQQSRQCSSDSSRAQCCAVLCVPIQNFGYCAALSWEYFGLDNIDYVVSWLFAGCLLVQCRKYSAQSSTHYLLERDSVSGLLCTMNCSDLKMLGPAADHRIIVAGFPKRQTNSHLLLLSCVWEQEELHLGFQFQLCSILPDWYLGNQSIMCNRNWHSAQLDLFVDARCWSANFVSGTYMHVRATCSIQRLLMICYVPFARFLNLVETLSYELEESVVMDFSHVTELQDASAFAQLQWVSIVLMHSCGLIRLGKLCPNWRFAHSASGRPALLISIQSVALENIELWWYATALLTEISSMFSTEFSMHLVVTCSVKSILLLTHAYQFHIRVPIKFSFAWSNLDNHEAQWDSALYCLFNAIKQFSLGPVIHMQQLRSFSKSEWSGELIQCLVNNLRSVYQIWLLAWTLHVFEISTSCGQAPFQGVRDVSQAAFSYQVHFNHDYYIASINQNRFGSYNHLNQALYFVIGGTDLIYYREDSRDDSSKSKEIHMPWDPGKLVLRHHRKLRLEDKPSFKEGGVLAPSPAYPLLLGCYDGLHRWAEPRFHRLYLYTAGGYRRTIRLDHEPETAAAANPIYLLHL